MHDTLEQRLVSFGINITLLKSHSTHEHTHDACMLSLEFILILSGTRISKSNMRSAHMWDIFFSKINMREWLTTSQDSTSKTSNDRNIPEKRSSFEISSKNRVKIEFNYSHMNAFPLDEYSF